MPHWLRLNGELRSRFEAPTAYGFKPRDDDGYALTRAVLSLDASPTSWFRAFVQGRDAEALGANRQNITGSMKDAFDLEQAYIELRSADHGWLSLQVGRQKMIYGDERLVGQSNWSNAGRSFDALRLRLKSKAYGVRMDTFASTVVKNYPTALDRVLPGQNFYGEDVEFTKLVPKATVGGFVYLKTLPSVIGVDKLAGNERLYTSGARAAGKFGGNFDYHGRYAFQSGRRADDPVHAWGAYGVLGYTIPRLRFQPRISIECAEASGNKAIGDRVIGTFDQLYPTSHGRRGLTDSFAEANIKNFKPGFDFKPGKNMRVFLAVNQLWLASKYDGLYDSRTAALLVKVPAGGAPNSKVGTSIDLYGTYDINPKLALGAGLGRLYPGPFLKENTSGGSPTYPYLMLDYRF